MSNFKKLFSAIVTTLTVLSAVAVVPSQASAAAMDGDLIKMAGNSAVYYLMGGKRYVFPNQDTYMSWYADFSQVKTIPADELQGYMIGGNVTMRPGTYLVKITTDPKVYAVEPGGKLRHVSSEAIAAALWGSNWAKMVRDVSDAFFVNYTSGTAITSNMHPEGSLVKYANNSTWYYIQNGQKRAFASEAAVAANMMQSKFGVETTISYPDGSSITGSEMGGALPSPSGSAVVVATGDVQVMLASDTPASSTVVAGQAIADLAHFNFKNNGSTEVKVTTLNLKRTGVSADTTLSNLYLYDGVTRLTDGASVSSGNINFNDSAGLFSIPAGGMKMVSVKSNIAASTSGQTVGVSIDAASKVVTSPSATINGVFPVSGNIHTVAQATMATVDFNSTTNPTAVTISPQDSYRMWENVVSIGNRAVTMKSFQLRQIGSIYSADVGNFKLYVDGVQVGNTVPALNSQGYVVFDLGLGVVLQTGNRAIKMLGDIISGSSRNFSFSLRQAGDAMFIDSEFNQAVLATAAASTFSARSSGTQTIDSGSLTITKKSNSASGDVVKDASNASLGTFEVKAYGETMKVESLRVRIDENDNDTAYTLRNGALYLDGAQVGSTAAIAGDTDATQAYTEFTFGSSFQVVPGTPRTLEIRADIFDNDGANGVAANDTIQVEIVAGSSNVQRMTSLGYGSYPSATVEGNTLTVKTGSLTVAKNTTYANHTIVAPKIAYKLGSYNIQASTSEGSTITSVVVDWDTVTDAFDASDDLTSLYIMMGSYTSPIKATVSDSGNTFSTNVPINAGQTIALDVYADVAASATDGAGAADTGISSVTVSYTTSASSTSTSHAEVTGQTITFGAGTFETSLDNSSPVDRIVAGNQEVEAARYKFQATNETYTIKEVQVKVGSAAISSAITEFRLYDGTNLLGSAPFAQSSNTAALITGLNVQVPPGSKTLIAKLMLNTIGTGAGSSQQNAALTLDSVKYADSQGAQTTDGTDRAGNAMYVYKTVPTVTQVALASSKIVNGQPMDLYKFTVSAPSQGSVSIKQFKFPVSWTDGSGAGDTLLMNSFKFFEDGSDITTTNVVIQDQAGQDAETTGNFGEADTTLIVTYSGSLESTISAGSTKTYTVRGTPAGFNVVDAATTPTDNFGLYLAGDASHNGTSTYINVGTSVTSVMKLFTSAAAGDGAATAANLIWSDNSSNSHNATAGTSSSGDWANGYKVLNLDLNAQTWNN